MIDKSSIKALIKAGIVNESEVKTGSTVKKRKGKCWKITVTPNSPTFGKEEQKKLDDLRKALQVVTKLKTNFSIEDKSSAETLRQDIIRLRSLRKHVEFLVRLEHTKHRLYDEYASVPLSVTQTSREQVKNPPPPNYGRRTIIATTVAFDPSTVFLTKETRKQTNHIYEALRHMKGNIKRVIRHDRERSQATRLKAVSRTIASNGERININYQAWTHIEEGGILELYTAKKYKVILSPKTPKEGRYVGVEIEFYCAANQKALQRVLGDAGLAKHVHLKHDGSIRPPEGAREWYPHEIAILGKQENITDIVSKTCDALMVVDAEANISCGLHVHIDCRGRDAFSVFNKLLSAQDILFSMMPPSRKSNRYCQYTKTEDWDRGDRYRAINAAAYSKYRTIEVRLHNGTVNKRKINNWIKLLLGIADTKDFDYSKNYKSSKDLLAAISADKELSDYVTERIAQLGVKGKPARELDEDAV